MNLLKNNKIIITGACGFIGSHLVEYLYKQNYDIIAFDRYNPNKDIGWLKNSKIRDQIYNLITYLIIYQCKTFLLQVQKVF